MYKLGGGRLPPPSMVGRDKSHMPWKKFGFSLFRKIGKDVYVKDYIKPHPWNRLKSICNVMAIKEFISLLNKECLQIEKKKSNPTEKLTKEMKGSSQKRK